MPARLAGESRPAQWCRRLFGLARVDLFRLEVGADRLLELPDYRSTQSLDGMVGLVSGDEEDGLGGVGGDEDGVGLVVDVDAVGGEAIDGDDVDAGGAGCDSGDPECSASISRQRIGERDSCKRGGTPNLDTLKFGNRLPAMAQLSDRRFERGRAQHPPVGDRRGLPALQLVLVAEQVRLVLAGEGLLGSRQNVPSVRPIEQRGSTRSGLDSRIRTSSRTAPGPWSYRSASPLL
jgi:hypothetical protein